MTNTLPDKPSQLIRLALKDMEQVLLDERYILHFYLYHKPLKNSEDVIYQFISNQFNEPIKDKDSKECVVCFAGAVMSKSLGLNINEGSNPFFFESDTTKKLFALDSFRDGYIKEGLIHLDIECYEMPSYISINNTDKNKFVKDMSELASKFESIGF